MGFGRNPHVAKAEAAEQKALVARDDSARALAWREAARQWDRAAERETDDKRKQAHLDRASTARATADGTVETEEAPAPATSAPARVFDKTSN